MSHPRDLLRQLEASPLKSLSQNFLTSPHWAEKLVDSFLSAGEASDTFWEVGPGLGALTEVLVKKSSKPVRLFEIDRKLAQFLKDKFPETPLDEGDFLSHSWSAFLKSKERVSVLSNLPYHLSSAMIFKMIENKAQLDCFLFTFQKEFAQRLSASPETKDYGSLTLIVEIHFEIKSLGIIPPGAFYPAPSVASEAILFSPRALETPHEEFLVNLIKASFKQRRKKMISNLKLAFPSLPWPALFEKTGLNENIRAESLKLSDFVFLSNNINNLKLY